MLTRHTLRATFAVVAFGLALLATGCSGGGDTKAEATGIAGPKAAGGGNSVGVARGAPTAIAQTRAIGRSQDGTLPVWLTSYAILPWAPHVDQPGRQTFTVSNRSTKRHTFAVVKFDGDPRTLPTSANLLAFTQLKVVGQTDIIEPGRELDLALDLEPGRYVLTSMFAQDYLDGMAAGFSVGGARPSTPAPKQPADGGLGLYMTEYGAFASSSEVRGGRTKVSVQNVGSKAREFAIIRWRGLEDALPTQGGLILLDGLHEVHRFETIAPGGTREIEIDLQGGFSYVLASLARGEYEQGIHTQVKVN